MLVRDSAGRGFCLSRVNSGTSPAHSGHPDIWTSEVVSLQQHRLLPQYTGKCFPSFGSCPSESKLKPGNTDTELPTAILQYCPAIHCSVA